MDGVSILDRLRAELASRRSSAAFLYCRTGLGVVLSEHKHSEHGPNCSVPRTMHYVNV